MDNIQENSIIAYYEVKPKINKMQNKIFDVILLKNNGISAKEISRMTGIPINVVVARVNELMYEKQIIKIKYKKNKQSFYAVRYNTDPHNVRRMTPEQKLKRIKKFIESDVSMFVAKEKILKIINQ